jgi:hypothetical protein
MTFIPVGLESNVKVHNLASDRCLGIWALWLVKRC